MPSFNYDFPYASKKLPVFAENVVASSQHLAATAGLRMMAKGGNAVDAAIASAIVASTVTSPTTGSAPASSRASSPTPVASATSGICPTMRRILSLVTAHGACQRSSVTTRR